MYALKKGLTTPGVKGGGLLATGLSLNHLVGAQEDRLGDRNAKRLRGL